MQVEHLLNVANKVPKTGEPKVKQKRSAASKSASSLKQWFSENGGRGWVDVKASKREGKFVPCGRKSATEKRKTGYPACRATMQAATAKGIRAKKSSKRVKW